MNKLLSTTALVVALGFPTLTLAQATEPAKDEAATAATQTETGRQATEMPGFLAERSQSDLLASDLIGHEVHARRAADDTGSTNDQAADTADGMEGMAMMNRADLDQMDNIGEINEIVLSGDGQVRAIVIGVGGFLGMGEHDVAVTMDQISFMSDADDPSRVHIVVDTGADMLKTAPAYERNASTTDAAAGGEGTNRATAETNAAQGDSATRSEDRMAFAAPEMEREGYQRVEAKDVSTELLTGKIVYDTDDNDVGKVTDMLLDDDGKITNVVIDFGGFLGIGNSQASLQYNELTILTTEGYEDVRIYVDATKQQIQELPRYVVSN